MRRLFLLSLLLLAVPAAGHAHPHVWITYKVKIVAEKEGIARLDFDWMFDKMFTEVAFEEAGVKKKPDLDAKDTKAIEDTAFASVKDYNYFIFLKADGEDVLIKGVENFAVKLEGGQMRYLFTMSLPEPAKSVSFQLYDPSFYIDVSPPMKRADGDGRKGNSFKEEKWVPDSAFVTLQAGPGAEKSECLLAKGKGVASVWGVFFPTTITCSVN